MNFRAASLLVVLSLSYLMNNACQIHAQHHKIHSDRIKTLSVKTADGRISSLSIIQLGTDQTIQISFDDLTHEYHRYTYNIIHCEADWTPSDELFIDNCIDGFASDVLIDDWQLSSATAVPYTHYHMQLPNESLKFKMSGNYMLYIHEDGCDEPVAEVAFMVCEPKFSVIMNITNNTDIDINGSYQQANLSVNYNGINVPYPERQIKTVVLQNRRWSTARWLQEPQFVSVHGQQFAHNRQLIFPGTNEFRKFEFLDIHRSSMGVENTYYDGENYHVCLYPDAPRLNYVYDEDANGDFFIRNTFDRNNDTESEYYFCHFTYRTEKPFDGELYLNGQWTYDNLEEQYRMTYDSEKREYHCKVMLKMGYFSYQYLLHKNKSLIHHLPAEGNFCETENLYTCLVYFRPLGGRTDLLYSVFEKSTR